MNDKEKQIEEMAKDYYGYSIDLEEDCKFVAEEMYDKGHRKLNEDSVVLSSEEAERFRGQTVSIAKVKAETRKETTEKILNELYVQFSADYLVGLRNEYKDWKYADLIKRYAKQFGVEIKE